MLSPHLAIRCVTVSSALFFITTSAQAILLYQDTFSGSSATPLSSTTPSYAATGVILGANHGTANVNWNANSTWRADGSNSTAANNGSAYLPFTPQNGFFYDLIIQMDPTGGASDWFGMSFNGAADTNAIVLVSSAYNSILLRNDRTPADAVQTFTGLDLANGQGYDLVPDITGPLTLHVRLDTTEPNWTASWFIDEIGSIRGTYTYATNPTINYIGFGKYYNATGTVDNLSLSVTVIPEPSEIAAIGLAMLGGFLFWRRRAKRQTVAE